MQIWSAYLNVSLSISTVWSMVSLKSLSLSLNPALAAEMTLILAFSHALSMLAPVSGFHE